MSVGDAALLTATLVFTIVLLVYELWRGYVRPDPRRPTISTRTNRWARQSTARRTFVFSLTAAFGSWWVYLAAHFAYGDLIPLF